jgi:hypothetical protein
MNDMLLQLLHGLTRKRNICKEVESVAGKQTSPEQGKGYKIVCHSSPGESSNIALQPVSHEASCFEVMEKVSIDTLWDTEDVLT